MHPDLLIATRKAKAETLPKKDWQKLTAIRNLLEQVVSHDCPTCIHCIEKLAAALDLTD